MTNNIFILFFKVKYKWTQVLLALKSLNLSPKQEDLRPQRRCDLTIYADMKLQRLAQTIKYTCQNSRWRYDSSHEDHFGRHKAGKIKDRKTTMVNRSRVESLVWTDSELVFGANCDTWHQFQQKYESVNT